MNNTTVVPQDLAYRTFHDAMRLFAGQGKHWSCAAVADASGIALRTVESCRSGQATPTIETYQSLCSVPGPSFFAATLKRLPFEVRSTDPADITPQTLPCETLSFGARLAEVLEDGRIDHTGLPELRAGLLELERCSFQMRVCLRDA